MLKIYHNPRCSKSRQCLAFADSTNEPYEVVNYLTDVPTLEELQILLGKLQIEPMELVRENEKIWIEKYKGTPLTDIEIIKAMVANPILIERPIIVNGDRAIIGRPIENIKRIL